MKQAFHDEIYDTTSALLLARHRSAGDVDAPKEGRVFDLYRTPAGSYFKYEMTASLFVEEEQPEIIPITPQEALLLYKALDDRQLDFEDAFPAAYLMNGR